MVCVSFPLFSAPCSCSSWLSCQETARLPSSISTKYRRAATRLNQSLLVWLTSQRFKARRSAVGCHFQHRSFHTGVRRGYFFSVVPSCCVMCVVQFCCAVVRCRCVVGAVVSLVLLCRAVLSCLAFLLCHRALSCRLVVSCCCVCCRAVLLRHLILSCRRAGAVVCLVRFCCAVVLCCWVVLCCRVVRRFVLSCCAVLPCVCCRCESAVRPGGSRGGTPEHAALAATRHSLVSGLNRSGEPRCLEVVTYTASACAFSTKSSRPAHVSKKIKQTPPAPDHAC